MSWEKLCFGILLLGLGLSFPFIANTQGLNANPTAITFNINNKNLYTNGSSLAGQLSTFSGITLLGTSTLSVSAASSTLSTGGNTIPVNIVKVAVSAVTIDGSPKGGTFTPAVLSTASQTIMSVSQLIGLGLNGPMSISLQYTLSGGSDLLKPSGTYSTILNYKLIFQNLLGVIANTYTGTVTLNITLSPTAAITIQNGSNTPTLTFATAADYQSGVSLTQIKSLNVFGSPAYTVSLTASGNLVNGANYIGIGNITLTPVSNPSVSGVSTFTVPLTQEAHTIITSGTPTLSQDFDLRYATQPAAPAFLNKPPGTYTTTLTYTITSP